MRTTDDEETVTTVTSSSTSLSSLRRDSQEAPLSPGPNSSLFRRIRGRTLSIVKRFERNFMTPLFGGPTVRECSCGCYFFVVFSSNDFSYRGLCFGLIGRIT
jgi:hypothetical protein